MTKALATPERAPSFLDVAKYEHHEITEKGVVFDPNTPVDYWLEVTHRAVAMFEGASELELKARIALADCLNFGEGNFKERYAQAIDATRKIIRLKMKTLQNDAWIFGSVPAENRHLNLDIGHHEAVAKLTDIAEQGKFLDDAEENEWSVRDLRSEIKKVHPPKRKGGAGAKKAVIDWSDEKSVLHAVEKIAEYLGGDNAGLATMDDKRQKEFAGRILAVVEAFGPTNNNKFFERLCGLVGVYLETIEEAEPLREWSQTRKDRWGKGLEQCAKAARRGKIGRFASERKDEHHTGTGSGADSAE